MTFCMYSTCVGDGVKRLDEDLTLSDINDLAEYFLLAPPTVFSDLGRGECDRFL